MRRKGKDEGKGERTTYELSSWPHGRGISRRGGRSSRDGRFLGLTGEVANAVDDRTGHALNLVGEGRRDLLESSEGCMEEHLCEERGESVRLVR